MPPSMAPSYLLTPPAARDIDGKQSKGHVGCYGAARILER